MKNFFKAICFGLIKKYSVEQKTLTAEIEEIETKNEGYGNHAAERRHLSQEFLEAPELTREMYYELLNRVFVGGHPKIIGREREIDIIYKADIASVLRHKLTKNDKMYDPTAHTLPGSAIKNRTFSISLRIFAKLYFGTVARARHRRVFLSIQAPFPSIRCVPANAGFRQSDLLLQADPRVVSSVCPCFFFRAVLP